MRMLERRALEHGQTVTISDERPTAQLEAIVAHAVRFNAQVVITVDLRRAQIARLRVIGGQHLQLISHSSR
jgi:hypothetical protein